MHLKHNDYMSASTLVFLVVGVVHIWRALNHLDVSFGSMTIPVGVSWIAGVVALYLAYSGYKTRH